MVDNEVLHLLNVLKDVSGAEIATKLYQIKENNDNHISHLFLEDYFRSKDADIAPNIYNYEAQCIVDIFPQYSVEYIQSMLETLGSENNRVIVILRQLLKNEPINNNKLTSSGNNYIKNNIPMCLDLTQTNSSSGVQCENRPTTVNGKYIGKRKSNTVLKTRVPKLLHSSITDVEDLDNYISPKENQSGSSVENNEPRTFFPIDETPISVASTSHSHLADFLPVRNMLKSKEKQNKPIITYPKQEPTKTESFKSATERYMADFLPLWNMYKPKEKENMPLITFPNQEPSKTELFESADNRYWADFLPVSNMLKSKETQNKPIITFPNQEPSKTESYESATERPSVIDVTTNIEEEYDKIIKLYNSLPPIYAQSTNVQSDSPCENLCGATARKEVDTPLCLTRYNDPIPVAASHANALDVPGGMRRSIRSPILITAKSAHQTQTVKKRRKVISPVPFHYRTENDDILDMFGNISSQSDSETESDSSLELIQERGYIDNSNTAAPSYDTRMVSHIMEMFPDASPAYIKQVCVGKEATPSSVDAIVQEILSHVDYPKRIEREKTPSPCLDLEEQVALLKDILPDADPNYLQYHADLCLQDKDKLKLFISDALESKAYPTRKEYLRKKQLSAQVKQYTTEFKIEKFLELIPDPEAYFSDCNRKSSLFTEDVEDVFSMHYVRGFLKNRYPSVSVKTINNVLEKSDSLTSSAEKLDWMMECKQGMMKTKRKPVPIDSTLQNIPLLQEIAYLSHRDEIKSYLEKKKAEQEKEKKTAKKNGLLQTCNCCYSDEVMPKNIVQCEKGCNFCSDCVKTSVEISFGEGKLDFPCLQDCGAVFGLQTLKDVLTPKMFSKMAQKKQLEEVKAAGIEELEMCPFCDFATIPALGDKLFRCLNSDCMKESCRQCKEPSHVPYGCDEIEKDDDVKKRTYIENKMTEALLRVCYKCEMKFIKADGCNKMTCNCGAMMCYVCGKPVEDYKHFNGQGGDQFHLCPLYSDTQELHKEAVIKGAAQAKVEIGVADDPAKLKIDPTADLHHHYGAKKHKGEQNYPPAVVLNFDIRQLGHRGNRHCGHRHHRHHHRD